MLADSSIEAVAIVRRSARITNWQPPPSPRTSTCSWRSRCALRTAAKELANQAAARGLVLMPGHTFLYSPPVLRIKDVIDSGELGDIYFISMSRVNLGSTSPT